MPAKINFPPEEVSALVERYGSGISMRKLAAEQGCSPNVIRNLFLLNGTEINLKRSMSSSQSGIKRNCINGRNFSPEYIRELKKRGKSLSEKFNGRPFSEERKRNVSRSLIGRRKHPNSGMKPLLSPEEKLARERCRQAMKRFLHRALKANGQKKHSKTEDHLGYNVTEFQAHLGPRPDGAHIDHLVPVAEFFRRGIYDPKVISALPNLRWLDADSNRRKSASVPENAEEIITKIFAHLEKRTCRSPVCS